MESRFEIESHRVRINTDESANQQNKHWLPMIPNLKVASFVTTLTLGGVGGYFLISSDSNKSTI